MLNIVNKSPFQSTSLDTCLRMAQPGQGLLLIEDAIYAATKQKGYQGEIRRKEKNENKTRESRVKLT